MSSRTGCREGFEGAGWRDCEKHLRRCPRILQLSRTSQLLSADRSNCRPSNACVSADADIVRRNGAHTLPLGGLVNHRVHSCISGCLTLKLSGS